MLRRWRCPYSPKITPLACIAGLAFAVVCAFTFIPNSVAATDLHIVLDSPKVRRLLLESSRRDKAAEKYGNEKQSKEQGVRLAEDTRDHPDKYTGGRSEFLQVIANEPGLTLPKGTYLWEAITGPWTSEESYAKCYPDAFSTGVFKKVRVVGWRFHDKEGWACGAVRPLLGVP